MQNKFIISQFRRPEVGNQGVSRANFFLRLRGECVPCLSPGFWWLLVILGVTWLQSLPPSSHGLLPVGLSLCPNFLLLIRTSGIWYLLLFIHSVMSNSLQPHRPQPTRLPVLHYLLEFSQTHVHWVNDVIPNHLIFCHPLLLPSIFPSIRVFSKESALRIRWPKDWSFSFSISPSSEYSGLISFGIDWFDLLVVQESSPVPQFKSTSSFDSQLSLWSNFHIHTWLLEKP